MTISAKSIVPKVVEPDIDSGGTVPGEYVAVNMSLCMAAEFKSGRRNMGGQTPARILRRNGGLSPRSLGLRLARTCRGGVCRCCGHCRLVAEP